MEFVSLNYDTRRSFRVKSMIQSTLTPPSSRASRRPTNPACLPREVCLAPYNVISCYPSKITVLNLQYDPLVLIFKYIVLFLSRTSIMDIRLCVQFYIVSVILSFIANSCSKVKTLCWASLERHKPE